MIELIVICALSLAAHLVSKWNEANRIEKSAGRPPFGLVSFVKTIPAQVAMAFLGSASSFLVCLQMGWFDHPNAGALSAACGWMGSSVLKKLVDQAQSTFGSK